MRLLKVIYPIVAAWLAVACSYGFPTRPGTPVAPVPITSPSDLRWPVTGPAPAAFEMAITVRGPDGAAPAMMTGSFRSDNPAFAGPYPCAGKTTGASTRLVCHLPAGIPLDNGGPLHVEAPGLQPFDGRANSAPEGCPCDPGQAKEILLAAIPPPLPPVPTRDERLNARLLFAGLTCDTKDFGVLPWFDPGLFSLSDAGRASVYPCKQAAGDTEAFILFDDVHGSIYNENDNPYYAFQSRHFEEDIPGFQAAVREVLAHGFYPKVYLGGDGPDGYPLAMRQFPEAHDALLHAGPNGEDLNLYVKYSPAWDSWFYGWEPAKEQIENFGRLVRQVCPACYLTGEINPGHLPQEALIDLSDYDGLDIEFGDNLHSNNTWGILERLIGPAYVRPADDVPPNDGADPHPRPWITQGGTPRGPFVTGCFEFGFDTYNWVRSLTTAAAVDVRRQYLRSIGCGAPGVPIS